jgi:hypothetical protein
MTTGKSNHEYKMKLLYQIKIKSSFFDHLRNLPKTV